MKKLLLSLTALALLAITATAQDKGPVYAPQYLSSTAGLTYFQVNAGTATNVGLVIDCRKQKDVNVQVSSTNTTFWAAASVAGSQYFVYTRGNESGTYDTALEYAAAPTMVNGTNTTTWSTNLNTRGCAYIYIPYFTNAQGSGTNTFFQKIVAGTKISAP